MSNYTSFEALDQDYEDKLSALNEAFNAGDITAVDRALVVGELHKWYDTEYEKIEVILDVEED